MRKEIIVPITDDNRDKGKIFVIKEMPASRAEKWAARALLALARSGVDLPDIDANSGIVELAAVGVKSLSKIKFEDAEPLLDDMFECITIRTDPKNPQFTRALVEDDIEEVVTRIFLRAEWFKLHTGF